MGSLSRLLFVALWSISSWHGRGQFGIIEQALGCGIVEYIFLAWKESVWDQPDRLSYTSSCPFVRVCMMPG